MYRLWSAKLFSRNNFHSCTTVSFSRTRVSRVVSSDFATLVVTSYSLLIHLISERIASKRRVVGEKLKGEFVEVNVFGLV
jgi:hypothetical protein